MEKTVTNINLTDNEEDKVEKKWGRQALLEAINDLTKKKP